MLFNTYTVFIYIFLVVLFYNAAKYVTKSSVVRNLILLSGNLLLLLTIVKEHTLIVLAILSLLVFLAGKLIQLKTSRSVLSFSIVLLLCLFSIRNYEFVQQLVQNSFLSVVNSPVLSVQKVGLSYILFRFLHWLIESHKKTIHRSDFLTFLNYIFFFPTYLAGPIDRYNNFHYWIKNQRLKYQRSLFFAGVARIFIGAFKTIGLVPFIIKYATNYELFLPDYSPVIALFLSLLAYSAYIYLDFSGYSDIAIGTAYLLGIKTPENFNNPYFSSNLSEFWKRWHITFSTFLSMYVFKPVIGLLNKIINPKNRLLVSSFGYIITFALCGLWHGSTLNFLYWGLWHGVGLVIYKLWQTNAPDKPFFNGVFYRISSVVLTFLFVTIGWVFFHYSSEQLVEIYHLLV